MITSVSEVIMIIFSRIGLQVVLVFVTIFVLAGTVIALLF
jgi:hypothetical protein